MHCTSMIHTIITAIYVSIAARAGKVEHAYNPRITVCVVSKRYTTFVLI